MIDQIWKNNELSKEEGLTLEQAMPIVEDYMESLNINVETAGQESILKNFAELDLDGNGQIDRDEMYRHLKKTKNLSSIVAENKANSQEQIEENKTDMVKPEEVETEEVKAEEVKAEENMTDEVKVDEEKTDDVKPEMAKTEEKLPIEEEKVIVTVTQEETPNEEVKAVVIESQQDSSPE